jgi:phosphatidylserine decarboxylase
VHNYLLLGILLSLLTTLPLAWKWQLGVLRVAWVVLALAMLSGLSVALVGSLVTIGAGLRSVLIWLLTMSAAFSVLAYRFYRDPERTSPDSDGAVVSPADGVVIYVRKSTGGMLPISTKHGHQQRLVELTKTPLNSEEAVVIGIGMSFTDVHVNRAPMKGRVTLQRHFPGRFGSLRRPEMVFENERATTVIEREGLQVAVVQIASRLVRKISVFVSPGQDVSQGQRIGVIRFGSQVDLVLPSRGNLRIIVQEGERVRAGESVVARMEHVASAVENTSRL